MFSFFSRRSSKLPINAMPYYYDTNLSKHILDTTNKIKDRKMIANFIPATKYSYSYSQLQYNLIPLISIISFLAGYYLSKYNN